MEMNHRACSSMFSKLRLKTVYTLSSISNLWFYDIIMWDFAIIPFTITLNLIATQILINRRIPWMQLPFTTVKCAPKHATPKHVSVASECERNQKQCGECNPCGAIYTRSSHSIRTFLDSAGVPGRATGSWAPPSGSQRSKISVAGSYCYPRALPSGIFERSAAYCNYGWAVMRLWIRQKERLWIRVKRDRDT